RDRNVTGVQTCALPIYGAGDEDARGVLRRSEQDGRAAPRATLARHVIGRLEGLRRHLGRDLKTGGVDAHPRGERGAVQTPAHRRSEERRVGKGGRTWRW